MEFQKDELQEQAVDDVDTDPDTMVDFDLHLEDKTQCPEADSILNKSSDCSQREDRHQGRQSKLKSKDEAIKEAKSGLEEIMKRKAEGQCPKSPKKDQTQGNNSYYLAGFHGN